MTKHADDDEVTVSYSASSNISFYGNKHELGYTWGEWRELPQREKDMALDEFLYNLVDIAIDDEEDE